MKKASLLFTLLAMTLATSALALNTSPTPQNPTNQDKATVSSPSGLKQAPPNISTENSQPASQTPTSQASAPPQDKTVPVHIVYDQMFRHIKELNKKADEEDRQGKDGGHFRTLYKRLAKLQDHEAQALDKIARDVDRELEPINKKAIELIRALRERHPGGKLAQGELPPAPPAELQGLSEQRRQVILQARESLRGSIGDEAFQRFDNFVQERIKPGIRRLDNAPSTQGTNP
jgi:hypothetical protein